MANRVARGLTQAESLIAWMQRALIIIVILSLALLMVVQIILRYGLEEPFLGIEETSVLLGLWFYFLGAAYVTREEAHIRGGVAGLVIKNPKTLAAIRLIGTLLCIAAIAMFTYYAYKYAAFTLKIGRNSSYLEWPTILWVASMLFGFIMMAFYFVLDAYRQSRALSALADR